MSMVRQLVWVPLLVATASATVGCVSGLPACRLEVKNKKQYFRVDYRLRSVFNLAPREDVRGADRFAAVRSTWNSVAVRRPEKCSDESSGEGTGSMDSASTKLGTTCGFWLAEIERGLAKNKFSVISWKSLEQVEHTKGVPTYVAARDLGADVVFIVNSLDASAVKKHLGSDIVDQTTFFRSNVDGDRLDALPVSNDLYKEVMQKIVDPETDSVRRTKGDAFREYTVAIHTMLDVTAVDTKTGEAVWFYLKELGKPKALSVDKKFLFGWDGQDNWWPVTPSWLKDRVAHPESERATAQHVREEQSESSAENPYKREVDELTQQVVDNFLSHFRSEGG